MEYFERRVGGSDADRWSNSKRKAVYSINCYRYRQAGISEEGMNGLRFLHIDYAFA